MPDERPLDELHRYYMAGWISDEAMMCLKRFFIEREQKRVASIKQLARDRSKPARGMMELFDE